MHQQSDHRQSPGALCAGDRTGLIQRGSGSCHLHQGQEQDGATAAAGRLFSGMERGVCTLAISLPLFLYPCD